MPTPWRTTQAATLALVGALSRAAGRQPVHVNLGGGFGIPYFPKEQPLDLARVGERLADSLDARAAILQDTAFSIELGRWLVGEAGVYLTRVVDRKVSRGATFLVTDGGLHHQLAASGNFGTVVRRNYPVAVAHAVNAPEATREEVTVVGCLCTPLDKLADQVALPPAQVGDTIAIFMAGGLRCHRQPGRIPGPRTGGRAAGVTGVSHPPVPVPAQLPAASGRHISPNAIFTGPRPYPRIDPAPLPALRT